jgi:hypothetical protein
MGRRTDGIHTIGLQIPGHIGIKITKIDLNTITEEKLLETRMCELPITIKDTWLESCVEELHKELADKELNFKPKCYLADEWLTPDKEPIIGIPFYLAHPTLIKLEKKMMLEAEGDSKEWCLKLLRHECGHAINYAFKCYKKRKWQNIFGKFSEEYDDGYRFRPYSRAFVRHLEDYYAQYHPDEDFSETFAVWLTPETNWEDKYKGWPALEKLEYVNQLMAEFKGIEPLIKSAKPYWEAKKLKRTLKYHYKKKQDFHAEDFPHFHDTNLLKIFSKKTAIESSNQRTVEPLKRAAPLLRKHRKAMLKSLSRWTGEKKYVANDLLTTIIKRCQELNLVCKDEETVTLIRISTYITTLLMNYLYTGRMRGN